MFYQFNHLGSPEYLKIEQGQNFSFPLHLHQCFEIIALLSGEMNISVDGKNYLLNKGESLLVFPNQIHELGSVNSQHILCIFSPSLVRAYSNMVSGKIPVNNHFLPDVHLIDSLTGLSDASFIEKKGILYSLCGQFDKKAQYRSKESDKNSLLHIIFSFVEEHYNEDCSLERLSACIGYDYSYISRIFKKTTGISFNAYVSHYRLSHACYMMESTDLPIIQCAYESGFASLRSFNRNFKQQFHMTPLQYRNRKNH